MVYTSCFCDMHAMHVRIGGFSNKIQMFLYGLHSVTEHFAPLLCECRAKHVGLSISLDVSYQWSKATALNFSQEVSYLTTALSLCLFSSMGLLPRYCGHCKKGSKSAEKRHAVFIQNLIQNTEHMVIAKLLSRKHKCVIPKNPLRWRNNFWIYRNLHTAKGLKVGLDFGISWNQGKESFIMKLNYS